MKFTTILSHIQQFMDTEVELTEQAIHEVKIRPRIPYFLGGVVLGSWFAMIFMYVLNLYVKGVIL